LEKLGRFDAAAAAYRRALELDPPNARAQEGLARVRAAKGYSEEGSFMSAGLRALYEENDPVRAQASFRKVLELNPAHYGATFQLAVALDGSGQGPAARPLWEKVLSMSEVYHDQDTATRARSRLKTGP
jgi:cytochrome c-type biogenesis protein CcmH/NrfG